MNILITGGAGFIGSHVAELMVNKGHKVLIVDNMSTGKNPCPGAITLPLDITQTAFLRSKTVEDFNPQMVLHLAAHASVSKSFETPAMDLIENGIGTLNVIHVAIKNNVKRIIFASTSAVYRDKNTLLRETDYPKPGSPYGVSKLAAESYLRCLFPKSVILRLANVYGPRQISNGENQVVAKMLDYLNEKTDYFSIHGDGYQRRDFIYVGDVARAFAAAMDAEPGIYNVATGHTTSVNGLAAILARLYHHPVMSWHHDDHQDNRKDVKMAIKLTQSKLEWEAETNLEDGLRTTMLWSQQEEKDQVFEEVMENE